MNSRLIHNKFVRGHIQELDLCEKLIFGKVPFDPRQLADSSILPRQPLTFLQ